MTRGGNAAVMVRFSENEIPFRHYCSKLHSNSGWWHL